jgi:hypothetical protein
MLQKARPRVARWARARVDAGSRESTMSGASSRVVISAWSALTRRKQASK